jgi:predicted porin
MKPKFYADMIFIALFCAGGRVYAQSSVSLYGVVDSGLFYQSTSASTFSPKSSNTGSVFAFKDGGVASSFWGLTGQEDIGNGYSVNFRLKGGFNSGTGKLGLPETTGASDIFGYQATVGISGPFGKFDAGRQFAPMIYAMEDTDVRGAQYFGSIVTAWLAMNYAANWSGTNTNLPLGAVYDSNALVYQTPRFLGTSLTLEYAPGGVPNQLQGGTRESAVLRYSNYGLNLASAYYNGHDANPSPSTAPGGVDNNRFYYFGALYTFRGISVSGSYSIGENPADRDLYTFSLISAGLGYQFSPSFAFTSGFYHITDRNNSTNRSDEFVLGVEYSLSKVTLLYAQAAHVRNKGTMNQGILFGQPVAPGVSTTAAMIGLRHNF